MCVLYEYQYYNYALFLLVIEEKTLYAHKFVKHPLRKKLKSETQIGNARKVDHFRSGK
jgi:hypothetical protein